MLNKKVSERLLKQLFDIWINPELERRKNLGKIDENFKIKKVQIIFSSTGTNKVRFNDEFILNAEIELKKGVIKKPGDPIRRSEIKLIKKLVTPNRETKNYGYVNMVLFGKIWVIYLDLRYNFKEAKKHLRAAKEFLEVCNFCHKERLLHPFFDNAFSCSELVTKSLLMFLPDEKYNKSKLHWYKLKRLKEWSELDNIDQKFFKNQERLLALRSSSRYLSSTEFKKERSEKYLKTLEMLIKLAEQRLSK